MHFVGCTCDVCLFVCLFWFVVFDELSDDGDEGGYGAIPLATTTATTTNGNGNEEEEVKIDEDDDEGGDYEEDFD